MKQPEFSIMDGLLRKNAVLAEGMVIAPVVICCDTLQRALVTSVCFAAITLPAVCIGSLYPKRLVYALRIILYALTAALLYFPASLLCQALLPDAWQAMASAELPGMLPESMLLFLPLLSVSSFVVLHSELYFYRLRRRVMLGAVVFHVAGFCLTACAVGFVRELLAHGSIFGHAADMPLLMEGLAAPWGGFLVLGLLCALHRIIFRRKQEDT